MHLICLCVDGPWACTAHIGLPRVFPVLVNSLILLIAAVLTGILSDRMREILSQMSQEEEQAELRKLRTAREQMRAIFELAARLARR